MLPLRLKPRGCPFFLFQHLPGLRSIDSNPPPWLKTAPGGNYGIPFTLTPTCVHGRAAHTCKLRSAFKYALLAAIRVGSKSFSGFLESDLSLPRVFDLTRSPPLP